MSLHKLFFHFARRTMRAVQAKTGINNRVGEQSQQAQGYSAA